MKVLLSAYACEPGRGSEPGVGWSWALAAARHHDVVVVTRANNRPVIERALDDLPDLPPGSRPRFDYLDLSTKALKSGARGVRTYYWQWQRALGRRALELHRTEHFDVAHHLTLAADWLPCGLSAVAGAVPLVWGPVGGATPTPWHLRQSLTLRGLAQEVARTLVAGLGRAAVTRTVARRAALCVALNSDVAASLSRAGVDAVVEQNAVITSLPRDRGDRTDGPPTAVYLGRLEGWKGILLAIETISRVPEWRLEVVGSGPDGRAARRLATTRSVADRVTFHGQVPLETARGHLVGADVMLLPSMHDSAPFAVAEAVAAEVPVVCLDRGGPPDMIRPGGGIAVPADSPDLPAALAAALERATVTEPYDGRFSAERLPGLVDRWYRSAVNGGEAPSGVAR